nr:CvpA family protein [uncultured Cetobacterium sp.]
MYLDIIIAVILIFAIIEGIRDGFLMQFFSIFGVIIDFILAKKLTPIVIDKLNLAKTDGNYVITYVGVLIVAYLAISIVMFFIGLVLKAQSKGLITRSLGGVFGAVKGVLISIIVLLVFNYASQRYSKLNEYSKDSKVNKVFLEKSYLIEDFVPKEIKSKIGYIKGKELVEKYFNKMF